MDMESFFFFNKMKPTNYVTFTMIRHSFLFQLSFDRLKIIREGKTINTLSLVSY